MNLQMATGLISPYIPAVIWRFFLQRSGKGTGPANPQPSVHTEKGGLLLETEKRKVGASMVSKDPERTAHEMLLLKLALVLIKKLRKHTGH